MYMLKFNLPQNMLEKDQYLALPSLQKEEYINNILREILRLNPLGITVSQISKATYFGRSTIWHHVELLAAKGECLRLERGNIDVYHLNEVIMHLKELRVEGTKLGSYYDFDLVKNSYDNYVRIQRKRESRTEANNTKQGIIVPYTSFNDFLNALNVIKEQLSSNK